MKYVWIVGLSICSLTAHVALIKDNKQLEKLLNSSQPLVVLFYELSPAQAREKANLAYKKVREAYKALSTASNDRLYTRSRVMFVAFNFARTPITMQFKRTFIKETALPALALIHNGIVAGDLLSSPYDQQSIKTFINTAFGDYLIKPSTPTVSQKTYETTPYYYYSPPYAPYYAYNPWWYWDWPYGCYYGMNCNAGPAVGFGFTIGI